MYTVHIDLALRFVPPMDDHGAHFKFTRQVSIPFPAYENLVVHSNGFEGGGQPDGWSLKHVVWDIDREVFIATVDYIECGVPVGEFVNALHERMACGWKLGWYRDTYPHSFTIPSSPRVKKRDWDRMEAMQEDASLKRPKWFRDEFNAMVRFLAENGEESTAYLLEKTQTMVLTIECDRLGSPNAEDASREKIRSEWDKLSERTKARWRKRIRAYPRIESLL